MSNPLVYNIYSSTDMFQNECFNFLLRYKAFILMCVDIDVCMYALTMAALKKCNTAPSQDI